MSCGNEPREIYRGSEILAAISATPANTERQGCVQLIEIQCAGFPRRAYTRDLSVRLDNVTTVDNELKSHVVTCESWRSLSGNLQLLHQDLRVSSALVVFFSTARRQVIG